MMSKKVPAATGRDPEKRCNNGRTAYLQLMIRIFEDSQNRTGSVMISFSTTLFASVTSSYDPSGCEVTSVAFFCPTGTSDSRRESAIVKLSKLLFRPTVSVRPMNPCLLMICASRNSFSAPTM